MSDEAAPPPPVKKKMSGKKLVLFIILPLILLGGGAAAAWFLLFSHPEEGEEVAMDGADAEGVDPEHPPIYFDLEEMTVNLTSANKRNSYLKLQVALELTGPEDQEAMLSVLPRVVDQFQTYLRGVKVEDLQGAEGLQRLREELLTRAQKAAKPANVRDVLFKVVQVQ